MQNAETVLCVLRERGRRRLPCDELYRQLFNPHLYLLAYGRLYSNHGAMTPGVDAETPDGMSLAKIGRIIDALRHERYRFQPVKRVYIPKKNGKTRPLGLPSWSDKLVGEVVRLLLEAYYEPQFSDRSHGFRPGRGCHTALREVATCWTGTTWFIESDIAQCFDRLDHSVMLDTLGERIKDNRFTRLLRNMLQAGYLEDWTWNATLSGVPQGGVASPILSNIYLDRLDKFVETVLVPQHTRGEARKKNPEYLEVNNTILRARRRGDRAAVRELVKQRRNIPSGDLHDPGYRRLRYARYADDQLFGFIGPKAEADEIKAQLTRFLRDELKLDLSQDKTLITHARTGAATFLGYEITVHRSDTKVTRGRRSANGGVGLRVPRDVIKAKCAPYLKLGKPEVRSRLVNEDDHTIVATYGTEYRGLVNYYLLAGDVWRLNRVRWVMVTSLLKTLACKHDSTVSTMAARYTATISTPHGPRTCVQATATRTGRKPLTATFGGIPLRRQPKAVLTDRKPSPDIIVRRKELINRLQAGRCEMCQHTGEVQVHHVGKLAHLGKPGATRPLWAEVMAKKRRKTLVVCTGCHDTIHHRQPTATTTE
jgi:group II intron reverse transcriptase/maturase